MGAIASAMNVTQSPKDSQSEPPNPSFINQWIDFGDSPTPKFVSEQEKEPKKETPLDDVFKFLDNPHFSNQLFDKPKNKSQ